MDIALTLAETSFGITSDANLYYPEEAGPVSSFVSASTDGDVFFPVNVSTGFSRDYAGMTPLAEADESWKLFECPDGRWFVSCYNMENGLPAWAAGIDSDCARIFIEYNELWANNGDGNVVSPFIYPVDQLLLIHILAGREGFLLHGTGVRRGNDVILFPGVSGAGKTTLADLIDSRSDLEILSDDRIVVRNHDGIWKAHGTPWPGEGGYAINGSGIIRRVSFLKKGDSCSLLPLEKDKTFERIVPVVSVPWYDRELMDDVISSAGFLANSIPGDDFVFTIDSNAIDQVEEMFDGR